jgi:hypothetical protein
VLIVIGVGSFVEVVLEPGSLVRGTNAPAAVAAGPFDLPPIQPELLFMSSEERHRREDIRRGHDDGEVREAHRKLGEAVVALEGELRRSQSTLASELKLSVKDDLALRAAEALAPTNAAFPTGAIAWNKLRSSWSSAESAIQLASDLHTLGAERIAANSYLPEDVSEFGAATRQLGLARVEIAATRADVRHLAILIKARGALTHSEPRVQLTGGHQ